MKAEIIKIENYGIAYHMDGRMNGRYYSWSEKWSRMDLRVTPSIELNTDYSDGKDKADVIRAIKRARKPVWEKLLGKLPFLKEEK